MLLYNVNSAPGIGTKIQKNNARQLAKPAVGPAQDIFWQEAK